MARVIITLVVLVVSTVSPWAIATAYVNYAGIVVNGAVIKKREAFVMPGGDSWEHIFEITYRFHVLDSPYEETASHNVDPALYHRLKVGSVVQVRYSASRMLRTIVGIGSFLTDSTPLSRLSSPWSDTRDYIAFATFSVAALIGLVAHRRKSKSLGIFAALVASTCFPVVLLAFSAFLISPVLFWEWRGNPGKGYGGALLGLLLLSVAVLYWRIPQPTSPPPSPTREATAIVRGVRVVDQLWAGYSEGRTTGYEGGQGIHPFQMVDLEFTPEGASDSIHVLDRVDLNGLAGLANDAKVQIYYSFANPSHARIAAGTRNFARQALIYLLTAAYGIGAIATFVVFPVFYLVAKRLRSSPVLGPMIAYCEAAQCSRFAVQGKSTKPPR